MSTSTGSEFDADDNETWPSTPYAYFLAPLLVLVLIALVITLFQVRRRKEARRTAIAQAALDRRLSRNPAGVWGAQTVRRSVGSAAHGAAPDGGIEAPRPARVRALRWVGLRAPPVRDEEEGLNELGEAPPPYEPPPKKDGDVELDELGRENAGAGAGAVGGNVTGTSVAAEPRPPDYEADASGVNARGPSAGGASGGATLLPPPAATPSR